MAYYPLYCLRQLTTYLYHLILSMDTDIIRGSGISEDEYTRASTFRTQAALPSAVCNNGHKIQCCCGFPCGLHIWRGYSRNCQENFTYQRYSMHVIKAANQTIIFYTPVLENWSHCSFERTSENVYELLHHDETTMWLYAWGYIQAIFFSITLLDVEILSNSLVWKLVPIFLSTHFAEML